MWVPGPLIPHLLDSHWGVFQGCDCICHLPSSWCWDSYKDFGLCNPDFQSSRACGPGCIVLVTCSCCHLIIWLLCSVFLMVLQSSTGSVLCCRCFPQLHDVGHGWTWAACSRQAGNATLYLLTPRSMLPVMPSAFRSCLPHLGKPRWRPKALGTSGGLILVSQLPSSWEVCRVKETVPEGLYK